MSVESGKILRVPRYPTHEFLSFGHCKTSADTTTDLGEDNSSDCYNTMKKPTSASSVTLNQVSTPSPSYPSANSWPGFGAGKQTNVDDIQVPTVDSNKSPSTRNDKFPAPVQSKSVKRVFVFTSAMANEAAICVQQKKYDSIIAWHEANCRPSTSKGEVLTEGQAAPVSKKKRRSVQDARNASPMMRSCGTPTICSPTSTMLPTPSNASANESAGNPPSNPSDTPSTSNDLLLLDDRVDAASDNPLRRMERMTQDSLFEPPSKINRTTEPMQPAKRDQERHAKLEKMRTLEQQLMYDKARSEWDRMVHEHEAIKIARGFGPSVIQPTCPTQAPLQAAQYPGPYPPQNPLTVQTPCRRTPFPAQMPPPQTAAVGMVNPAASTSVMPTVGGHTMPMSQPLRPSMNTPPCGMHYAQDTSYMCCPYPPNSYGPPHGYTNMPAAQPCCPSNYAMNNGMISGNAVNNVVPSQPREFAMYHQQGIRAMCPPDKIQCDIWNKQLPQPIGGLDNRVPSQKIQYHPNGAVEESFVDTVSSTNPMFV